MLASHIRTFLKNHQIRAGRILVAVSGGADSMALLRGLIQIADEFELQLCVGHFDHRLRTTSGDDASWVRNVARQLDIECIIGCRDQDPAQPMPTGELVARNMRYQFLQTTANQHQCAWIALAHTADDQTETILHHIIRGTGLNGLKGIPTRRILTEQTELIRPLLTVSRQQVIDFLETLGQDFRVDDTNSDPTFTRNRIRHQLLPLLRNEFNPQVDQALHRLAALASESQRTLAELAIHLLQGAIVERNAHFVVIDCHQLAGQPVGLVREMFSQLWQLQNWPRQKMDFKHFDTMTTLAMNRKSTQHSLPNQMQAIQRRHLLTIRLATD